MQYFIFKSQLFLYTPNPLVHRRMNYALYKNRYCKTSIILEQNFSTTTAEMDGILRQKATAPHEVTHFFPDSLNKNVLFIYLFFSSFCVCVEGGGEGAMF